MSTPDLNLLLTLDAVLAEGSVVGAAKRLRLSPSAMSRALARLREVTGDPLLVRSGRGLVPTPRALELRQHVGQLVEQAKSVLRPAALLDVSRLQRTFSIRTRDGFVDNFGPALIEKVGRQAPGVRLCFVQKPKRDTALLRDGSVDLETGVVDLSRSDGLCSQLLFTDRFVGVVRSGHALSKGKLTAARFAQGRHIGLAMHGEERGAIDQALAQQELERVIVATVDGFGSALALARASDLIACVPERHTGNLRNGLHSFELPLSIPEMQVSLLWHPRLNADQAH